MTDQTTEPMSLINEAKEWYEHLCCQNVAGRSILKQLIERYARLSGEPGEQHPTPVEWQEVMQLLANALSGSEGWSVKDEARATELVDRHFSTKPQLWCLHAIGLDDLYAAPSREMADAACGWYAERFKDHPEIRFEVIPWPWSAESHAADLPKWNTETMPQLPPTKGA